MHTWLLALESLFCCFVEHGKEDNIPLTVDNDDSTLLDSVERDEFIIHNDIDIVIMIKIDKIRKHDLLNPPKGEKLG
ncbi:hypothetical protein QL285_051065 [Trifolium repens]|nr:hypothetical protein QL285_051065 [Trifolium repens]